MLKRNCRLNHIPFPFAPALFHNAIAPLARTLARTPRSFISSDLPALGDARCIAQALRVLRRDGRL